MVTLHFHFPKKPFPLHFLFKCAQRLFGIIRMHNNRTLLSETPQVKAEIRRITNWFNNKFYREVTSYLINEKVISYYTQAGAPNSQAIRAAKSNLLYHLDYISYLIKRHKWLAEEHMTIADIAAASHLSVLDYLGDVPWEYNNEVKEWYSVIKSRPSFRPILHDRITNFLPASYYSNMDF